MSFVGHRPIFRTESLLARVISDRGISPATELPYICNLNPLVISVASAAQEIGKRTPQEGDGQVKIRRFIAHRVIIGIRDWILPRPLISFRWFRTLRSISVISETQLRSYDEDSVTESVVRIETQRLTILEMEKIFVKD